MLEKSQGCGIGASNRTGRMAAVFCPLKLWDPKVITDWTTWRVASAKGQSLNTDVSGHARTNPNLLNARSESLQTDHDFIFSWQHPVDTETAADVRIAVVLSVQARCGKVNGRSGQGIASRIHDCAEHGAALLRRTHKCC